MLEEQLKLALQYREENKLVASNELLVSLAKAYPDDSYIQYECASSYDCMGKEQQAVSYYEQAIEGNLNEEDLQHAYIGLGSTFRVLGDYEKSKSVIEKGLSLFPNNQALKIFYAMTLYNVEKHNKAMSILLTSIAEHTSNQDIKAFQKAIAFYAGRLDETFS